MEKTEESEPDYAQTPAFVAGKSKKEKEFFQQMEVAICSGNLEAVKFVVKMATEANVNLIEPMDETCQTVLHVAAYSGNAHIVEYLLGNLSVVVNARDKYGWTALLCAASGGFVEICSMLMSHGSDPLICNYQQTSTLHYLARKFQLSSKKDKKSKGNEQLETLYIDVLKALIDKGIDVNAKNYTGETALMQAAAKNNALAVSFLLENKANWKITNEKGETAYTYAQNANASDVIKILDEKIKKSTKKELITHPIRNLDNFSEVIELMKDPENGVPLSNKKNFFVTYSNVFTASDLIDWMVANLAKWIRSRDEAREYGQKLYAANWIRCVSGKMKHFKDNSKILRFSTGQPPEETAEEDSISEGDFDEIRILGKGAFGIVKLVQKKGDSKLYAMKVIDKSIMHKPRDFKHLMTERKILQNDCTFLVHMHWAFQTDSHFLLVMDFIGGGDLYYHLKNVKRFNEKVVTFVVAELVLAISFLHSRGIIYRDLKPQNILLDQAGHVCLADFGLATEIGQTTIAPHTACGTPSYSALEVLIGKPYGKSIDWWALGVVMYQLLVGNTPFSFSNGSFSGLIDDIKKKVGPTPTNPLYFPDEVSINARSIILSFLSTDINRRLDDADIIKRHPFFKNIDWAQLELKRVIPPLKPSADFNKNFPNYKTKKPSSTPKSPSRPSSSGKDPSKYKNIQLDF